MALNVLGLIARDEGDYDRATLLLEDSLERFRQLGDRGYLAHTEIHLGAIASARGDDERATELYKDSLMWRRGLQEKRGVASCLAALACAAAGLGRHERAATLFGAAEALRETLGAPVPSFFRSEYDRRVEATSSALGEAALKTAWAVGRAMAFDQAIEFALAADQEDRIRA